MAEAHRILVKSTGISLIDWSASNKRLDGNVTVWNRGTESVNIGGPDLVWGAGFELTPNDNISIDVEQDEQVWAIAADDTGVRVDVLLLGL